MYIDRMSVLPERAARTRVQALWTAVKVVMLAVCFFGGGREITREMVSTLIDVVASLLETTGSGFIRRNVGVEPWRSWRQ